MPKLSAAPVTVLQRIKAAGIVKRLRNQANVSTVSKQLGIKPVYTIMTEKMTKKKHLELSYYVPHLVILNILKWDEENGEKVTPRS